MSEHIPNRPLRGRLRARADRMEESLQPKSEGPVKSKEEAPEGLGFGCGCLFWGAVFFVFLLVAAS